MYLIVTGCDHLRTVILITVQQNISIALVWHTDRKISSSTVQPDSYRLESGTDTYILASFDTLRYTQLHPANCSKQHSSSPFVLSPPNLLQPLQHSFIFSIVIGFKEVSWIHVVALVICCLFSRSPAMHSVCIR